MQRSLANRAWQALVKFLARLTFVAAFQIRCHGRELVPTTGGALVLSNHQSNLDPILIGLASNRRLNYLARKTLFRFKPLAWMLTSVDSIPIDREGSGFGGLKETLKRIQRGEIVLLFPEGTRTSNGEIARVKPGFGAIARRAAVPLIPVAIDGAFDAWPRQRLLPRRAVIHVCFGEPIPPEAVASMSDDEMLAEVQRRIEECHALARAGRLRAMGR